MAAGRNPTESSLGYLPALDGLRAVALLTVLCFHAGFGWVSGGYLPLTSFFVLSGFLITALLLVERERTGGIGIRRFWARRVRRLFPAAVAGVVLAAAFTAVAGTPEQASDLRGDVIASLANVANWRFVLSGNAYGDLFGQPSPLQHYWSLAVEEQFYLVFPLLVGGALALGRGRRRVLGAVLVAGVVASTLLMRVLHSPGDAPLRVYFGSDTRAGEILVGALLALALVGGSGLRNLAAGRARLLDGAGLLALVASVALWFRADEFDPRLYEGGLLLISLLAALVVAACTLRGGLTARLLGAAPLAALGRISYGVYIFHWPLFLWLDEARTGLSQTPLFALRMALTVTLALAFYRTIEQPLRAGRALRWPVAPVAWGNATVAACALAALVTVPAVAPAGEAAADEIAFRTDGGELPEGPPPTAPPPVAPVVAPPPPTAGGPPPTSSTTSQPAAAPSSPRAIPPVAPPPTAAPRAGGPAAKAVAPPPTTTTAPPPPSRPVRVMVVGDSLGQNLASGLSAWAGRTRDMVVWDLTLQSCAISRGGSRRLQNGRDWPMDTKCAWWASEGASKLREFQPDVVLVQTGHGEIFDRTLSEWNDEYERPGDSRFDPWLVAEYQAAVDIFASTGAKVAWAVPPCVEADRNPGFIENEEGNRRLRHIGRAMTTTLAGSRPVEVLDVDRVVCPGGRFADTVAGVADARPDGWHLTRAAAEALADQWLAPAITRLARAG